MRKRTTQVRCYQDGEMLKLLKEYEKKKFSRPLALDMIAKKFKTKKISRGISDELF